MQGFKQSSQNQNYGNYSQEAFQIIDQQRQRLEQKIQHDDKLKQHKVSQVPKRESVEKFNFQNQLSHSLQDKTHQDQQQIQNSNPNIQYEDSQSQYGDESQIQKLIYQYQEQQERNHEEPNEEFPGTDNDEQEEEYVRNYNKEFQNYQLEEEGDHSQDEEDQNYLLDSQVQEYESDQLFPVDATSAFQQVSQRFQNPSDLKYKNGQSQDQQQLQQRLVKMDNTLISQKTNELKKPISQIVQEDIDNDFLIKMKIQEQMKKYDQSKQYRHSEDEQEKNKVKQQVWEQLFNKKEVSKANDDFKLANEVTGVQTKSNQSRKQQQIDQSWNKNQVNNLDQTISILQQNSKINPSITNQYINNFIMNQINSDTMAKEQEIPKQSRVFSKQLQESKLKKQQIIKEENFQDKFQSQLIQLPQQILNNQIPLQYQDSLEMDSQISTQSFGQSKNNNSNHHMYEHAFEPQQSINFPFPAQLNQSNKQEGIPLKKQPISREERPKSIHEFERQDFSLSQNFDEKFFESPSSTSKDQVKQDSDDDMEDLNNRESELFVEESYATKYNGVKALQQIQEVEESQFRVNQTDRNSNHHRKISNDVGLEDEQQNKFIQFDIALNSSQTNDQNLKQKNYELLKKKKLDEMERTKLERQKKRLDEENEQEIIPTPKNKNLTPSQRDRSPLMPSAQGRGKKVDEFEQVQFKKEKTSSSDIRQIQKEKTNNYSDNFTFNDKPSPLPPKQVKTYIQEDNSVKKVSSRFDQIDRPISGKTVVSVEGRNRNNSSNKMSNKLDTSQNNGRVKKNNRQMLKNAIMNVCLAGDPNKREREAIIAQLESVEADHFIILLKGQFGRMDFKALYGMNHQDEIPNLLFQSHKSPSTLDPAQVICYLKYDSGAKEFKPISGNKTFSYIVDAVKLKK